MKISGNGSSKTNINGSWHKIAQGRPLGHPDSQENMDWERDQMIDNNPVDPQKALIDAVRSMLEVEASACMRSEAVGEQGMRERFTALRQALHGIEGQNDEEWPETQDQGNPFMGPSGPNEDEPFSPYGRM